MAHESSGNGCAADLVMSHRDLLDNVAVFQPPQQLAISDCVSKDRVPGPPVGVSKREVVS